MEIDFYGNSLAAVLPLTQPTGKIRVKTRGAFSEYGEPVAVRQVPLTSECYAEWQIGYDLLATPENTTKTTLVNKTFKNYKGETKYAYELSEILYYAHRLGLLKADEIREAYDYVRAIPDDGLIDTIDSMQITRTEPARVTLNGIDFYQMKLTYPLIVHQFGKYDIYSEVMNREKQRGVGVQPMLYVCIPITELDFDTEPLGRALEPKECGRWQIGVSEARLALELFKIFGMLSKKHQHDVLAIMEMLFGEYLQD